MTDTVRKAADILYQRSGVEGHAAQTACQDHAQALHDAGLLAPDLPEPTFGEDGALLWNDGEIWLEDDEKDVYTDLPRSISWMTPSQTRRLGYALIAAANHAEAEND